MTSGDAGTPGLTHNVECPPNYPNTGEKRGATESVANREYRTAESRRDRISSFSGTRCARSSVNYLDADGDVDDIDRSRLEASGTLLFSLLPLHLSFPIFVHSCGSMHVSRIQHHSVCIIVANEMESNFHVSTCTLTEIKEFYPFS